MRNDVRKAIAALIAALTLTSCGFGGINTLPLPGAVGRGEGATTYTVDLVNVGTLEPNSPVMIDDVVIGSIRNVGIVERHARVQISLKPGVRVPANVTAAVGQTSLLGSMHLELAPPPGQAPSGQLVAGAHIPDIPLDDSMTYPSTEQTLAALSTVVNAGGLGQIGDIIASLNATFAGRETDIRELFTQLDTFVGTLNAQRDNIIAAVTELNRFAAALAGEKETLAAALRDIQPALDILRRERPQLVEALDALRVFSDTAGRVVTAVKGDLIANLTHLAPTLQSLADLGPDISSALGYATIFPLNQNIIDRGIRGDYMNLFVTVDLTLSRFRRGLLAGTSFGDENAPLVPAPGDPGYQDFYTKNPLGEAVALPPGVMGPDRLPPPPGQGGG